MTKEEQWEKWQTELKRGNEELWMKKSAQKLLEEAKKTSKRENDRERQHWCRQRKALLDQMVDPVSGKTIQVSTATKWGPFRLAYTSEPCLREV